MLFYGLTKFKTLNMTINDLSCLKRMEDLLLFKQIKEPCWENSGSEKLTTF